MPRARRVLLRPSLAVLSLSLSLGVAQADTPLFSADGYRIGLYRSPTPNRLPGASIIDTPALQT
ncbi:PQQ-dependent catabolism-associated CXXCW motif protein, partial [Pseudomonas syringae]